jgi:CRP/FNR family transcriptional regulator
MVLLEGEPCEGLGFVVSGRVKVVKLSADGKEQVLRLLGPGRTFNDVPVFDGGPNPSSVQAVAPSVIGLLPKAAVQSLVDTQPKVAAAVIRVLASRLRALTVVIEDLALRGVVARVAKLLLDCARGHPALLEGPGGTCQHRLTQQEIAAMTGSVREVVQRALKSLERDGAIRMERARVVVLDPMVLERWSESGAGRP